MTNVIGNNGYSEEIVSDISQPIKTLFYGMQRHAYVQNGFKVFCIPVIAWNGRWWNYFHWIQRDKFKN